MKTILNLIRAAFGWQLFVWIVFFTLLNAAAAHFQINQSAAGETIIQALSILTSLTFTGYLFNVAIRKAKNQPKPLKPIDVKSSFVLGVRFFVRILFIALPMIAVMAGATYFNTPETYNFAQIYSLIYSVFVLAPFIFYLVKSAPELSWGSGLWNYFKKSASQVFAFIFWSALIYIAWLYFTQYCLNLAQIYATSALQLAGFIFLPFAILFYVLFLNAVLLGFFVSQTSATSTEVAVQTKNVLENPVSETVSVIDISKTTAKKSTAKGKVSQKKNITATQKTAAKTKKAPIKKKAEKK